MSEVEQGLAPHATWASGFRRLLPRAAGLSGLTIAGQLVFLIALPLLSKLFTPTALGLFTIYLSIVNIAGPLAGLRFESSLFGLADKSSRRVCLRLSLTVLALNSVLMALLAAALAPRVGGSIGEVVEQLLFMLPFGFFLSGTWSVSTAWAVRENALRTLSIARFVQPASMTILQVVFGLMQWPAATLVLAHLLSHAIYTGTIFAATLTREDLRTMAAQSSGSLARRAWQDRRFPLYVMPAYLMSVLISNAPPLVMGALFGTGLAGQYGVAYRVVTSPLSVICLPLGNLFTSEASRATNAARTRIAVRFVLTISFVFVVVPMLVFGVMAPALCIALLGPTWATAGQIMTALAVMGAAQALAAPFAEVSSIYRRPGMRLAVDAAQLVLFFLPLAYGTLQGWDALPTIRLMAAGGLVGYALNAASSLLMLGEGLRRSDRAGRPPAAPSL